MRALILGDTHGMVGQIRYALAVCEKFDVDTILQLGDFGFFPHTTWGSEFLAQTEHYLAESGIMLYFIDGNHENHDILERLEVENGMAQISHHVYHLRRGTIHTFGDTAVACLGGAYSYDRPVRTAGKSFWFGETITESDVAEFESQTADILLSHECPGNVDLNLELMKQGRNPYKIQDIENQRYLVQQAVNMLDVHTVYHGHHHIRYTQKPYNGLTVHGFGCDGYEQDSWTIVDL